MLELLHSCVAKLTPLFVILKDEHLTYRGFSWRLEYYRRWTTGLKPRNLETGLKGLRTLARQAAAKKCH